LRAALKGVSTVTIWLTVRVRSDSISVDRRIATTRDLLTGLGEKLVLRRVYILKEENRATLHVISQVRRRTDNVQP
jgi:hypothetical protein